MGPFRVVSWMTNMLDEVRKQAWKDMRTGRQRPQRDHKQQGQAHSAHGLRIQEQRQRQPHGTRHAGVLES